MFFVQQTHLNTKKIKELKVLAHVGKECYGHAGYINLNSNTFTFWKKLLTSEEEPSIFFFFDHYVFVKMI